MKRTTVIGAVNMDFSATMMSPFVADDSIPGKITVDHGGVARNIAHNLMAMGGHHVNFIGVFGGGHFGNLSWDSCSAIGFELASSKMYNEINHGGYMYINNQKGETIAAVSDTSITDLITPKFLEERLTDINNSDYIVADTNIPTESLQFLIDNSIPPLTVDAVSTAKAPRIIEALQLSKKHRLRALKLNLKEAQAATGCDTVEAAADALTSMGVEQVYITLGSDGVYCSDGNQKVHYDAPITKVVNTTGAGDAFVAGIIHGWAHEKQNPEYGKFPGCAQVGLLAAQANLISNRTVNPEAKKYMEKFLK